MKEDLQSYALFVLVGVCSTLALNFYLKQRLGTRWDNSLLWFTGGLFCWVLLLWLEISSTSPEEVQYLRRILSVVNSISFIMFLSYFDEAWDWLNRKIKFIRATPERFAIFLVSMLLLIAVTSFKDPKQWLIAETVMSIFVSLLLNIGFVVSFWRRKDAWAFVPLACIGGALLCWTQYLNLLNEQIEPIYSTQTNPFLDFNKMRPLAFFCLLANTYALAFTALGKEYDKLLLGTAEGASPAPASHPTSTEAIQPTKLSTTSATIPASQNEPFKEEIIEEVPAKTTELIRYTRPHEIPLVDSILISGKTNHIVVTFRLNTLENVPLEISYTLKELTKSMFALFYKHCQSRDVDSFPHGNFAKERRLFIEKLNAKQHLYGIEFLMDDIFATNLSMRSYRLATPLDKVEIDESARRILS